MQVVSLTGGNQQQTEEVAKKFGIPHWTGDLAESLAQPGVEAAILATPTQMHADQSVQCLRAGKHVQVEIPMADSVADAERVAKAQKETGLIAMAGHTRRFNPSHQWIHKRIKAGELKVLQMDVQTYFFRRTNMNALGKPRSWTDHLLWHHACHTVDLFCLSDRRGGLAGLSPFRARCTRKLGHRHGHGYSAEGHLRARSARCRCHSTTTVPWAPSSAISATTEPTSPAMTSWSTVTTSRSTSRRSMYP